MIKKAVKSQHKTEFTSDWKESWAKKTAKRMLCQDLQCKEQLSEGICGKFTTNNGKSNGIKCYL